MLKNIIKSISILFGFYFFTLLFQYINGMIFKETNQFTMMIPVVILIIGLIVIFKKDLLNDFKSFKENYANNLMIAFKYWIIGYLLMYITNAILILLIGNISSNETNVELVINQMPIYALFIICLLGPIEEEIVFRLNFRKTIKNDTLFCLITGLIFGLSHVVGYAPIEFFYLIPYGIMGYFFAKGYTETKSIFTSISIHMMHNIFMVIIILVFR